MCISCSAWELNVRLQSWQLMSFWIWIKLERFSASLTLRWIEMWRRSRFRVSNSELQTLQRKMAPIFSHMSSFLRFFLVKWSSRVLMSSSETLRCVLMWVMNLLKDLKILPLQSLHSNRPSSVLTASAIPTSSTSSFNSSSSDLWYSWRCSSIFEKLKLQTLHS